MHELREHYRHSLDELQRELLALGAMADEAIKRAAWALRNGAVGEAQALIKADDRIDEATSALVDHATRLIATQGPVAGDLRLISAYMQCAGEFERISDYAEGICKVVVRAGGKLADPLPGPIEEMFHAARSMLSHARDALVLHDPTLNLRLKADDDHVDALYEQFIHTTTAVMRRDPDFIPNGIYLLWVGHNLERIADRATNIAEYVEYIVRGTISSRPDE
jgi:phosphate transport system protein